MDENGNWKEEACEKQLLFFEIFGSRPYDEINKSDLFTLKMKVGFGTCGAPNELPTLDNYYTGYSAKNLDYINKICQQIVDKSDYDPIQFGCVVLIVFSNGEKCDSSVFKIGTTAGNIFIDSNSRVYNDWDSFMINNVMPACEYCFPINGEYYDNIGKQVNFAVSPACALTRQCVGYLDTIGSVTSIGAGAVMAASLCVTVAPVALATAGAAAACGAGYSVVRSTHTLYDRNRHGQSIGLEDQESRASWFSIATSALGATTSFLLQAQRAGQPLSRAAVGGLGVLNASSVILSSFGFVDSLWICKDKYNEGTLTAKDVFDLSCEMMFFFNALANARATYKLIDNMQAQKKLTKTQKRNLRKRAAKRRAKGIVSSEEPVNIRNITCILSPVMKCVEYYNPRMAKISNLFYSIGHDVKSWISGDMSIIVLIAKLSKNLYTLRTIFKDEISDVINRVRRYFQTPQIDNNLIPIRTQFVTADHENQALFCNNVINVEDLVEKVIGETEQELMDFYDRLEINLDFEPLENISQDFNDTNNDDELNQETQMLISFCGHVIDSIHCHCNDMLLFAIVFDCVKSILVPEYKEKVSNYKKSIEAAKLFCGSSFDIASIHTALNINGDVSRHIFSDVLQGISAASVVDKIKHECRERNYSFSPAWEAANNNMYHYRGLPGAGFLDEEDIFTMISDIIKRPLGDGYKKIGADLQGTLLIDTNCEPKIYIVVSQDITDEITAHGMVIVISNQENNI